MVLLSSKIELYQKFPSLKWNQLLLGLRVYHYINKIINFNLLRTSSLMQAVSRVLSLSELLAGMAIQRYSTEY